MLAQLSGGQRQHVAHDLIHTHEGFCGRSSLEQRWDSGQNLSAANAVPQNSLQGLSSFGQIWRIGCEPVQPRIGAGDNTGQRLVDFVGDRGCQLPHSRDSGNPLQFCPRLLQGRLTAADSLFGKLMFRDIHVRADVLNWLSARAEDGMSNNVDMSNGSVGSDYSELLVVVLPFMHCIKVLLAGPVTVLWMDPLKDHRTVRRRLLWIEAPNPVSFF